MANTLGRIAHNLALTYGTTSGTATTVIPEIESISGVPSIKVEMHDSSNLTSANRIREKIAGMVDLGEISVALNYINENATHIAIMLAAKNRTKLWWKFIMPDSAGAAGAGASYTFGPFEGVVSDWTGGQFGLSGPNKATFKITPTGDSVSGFIIPS